MIMFWAKSAYDYGAMACITIREEGEKSNFTETTHNTHIQYHTIKYYNCVSYTVLVPSNTFRLQNLNHRLPYVSLISNLFQP